MRIEHLLKPWALWLYSQNDKFFAPELSRAMYDAYIARGGKAQYVLLPAFGSDGHQMFGANDGRKLWQPAADKFLSAQ